MSQKLRPGYILANCCNPSMDDHIIGYFSHVNIIKVHKSGCANLKTADHTRLIPLVWIDIEEEISSVSTVDTARLDATDLMILRHHKKFGADYSLATAAETGLAKEVVFERHMKLRQS